MTDQSAANPSPGRLRERAAEEIRALLGRRKMSAAELARRTSRTQTYMSRRMTGEVAFDLDDLEVIARELGVSVSELLGAKSQTTLANLALAERPVVLPPKGPLTSGRIIPTLRRPVRVEGGLSGTDQGFDPFVRVA